MEASKQDHFPSFFKKSEVEENLSKNYNFLLIFNIFRHLSEMLSGPGALPSLIVFMASDTSSIVAPLSSVLFPSRQSFMFSEPPGTTAMKSDMEKTFWSLPIFCYFSILQLVPLIFYMS